ncbi:AMP-binding protein [Dyella amyloliquefaciens]|uniref:AMP-binding protein n=1 Tax=Dyella amyloliquefaciens TaxID=1770545 RepID=UPI00102E3F75|nr:AMP-binding protein [Dyella amyloliquefaciens]
MTTPTRNLHCPLRLGGFAALRDALDYAAHGETGINFFDLRGRVIDTLTYRALRGRALDAAWWLHGSGLPAGARVALVAETSVDFLTLFYACQYAGLVPCPLADRPPAGKADTYVDTLRRWLMRAGAALLMVPARLGECARLAAAGTPTVVHGYGEATLAKNHDEGAPAGQAHTIAYVQFSSGSTAEPKGVVVTQRALMSNATSIARDGLRMGPNDRAFSWLPLYHDMGLVGFSVVALCGQRSVDYLAPASFAARPLLWLRLMSAQGSTIVYAPPFAWELAAQRYNGEADIDLHGLRIAGVGGDMLDARTLQACVERLAPAGLRDTAMQPSYGMAEATLAISMTRAGEAPRLDHVRMTRASNGNPVAMSVTPQQATHHLVSSGRVLPGLELQARDATGVKLPDRHVGHLWVIGDSILQRYLDTPDRDVRDEHGFFDTGDLGYIHGDQVFVTGRAKDMVPIRGRNLWLADIEWAADRVAPLSNGDASAIVLEDGTEVRVALFLQRAPSTAAEREALRDKVAAAVLQGCGIPVRVHFVAPGSLPYTTSGKLARQRLRDLYLSGSLVMEPPVHTPSQPMEAMT